MCDLADIPPLDLNEEGKGAGEESGDKKEYLTRTRSGGTRAESAEEVEVTTSRLCSLSATTNAEVAICP